MKDRILLHLTDFAAGKSDPMADELKKELGFDDSTFKDRCQALLSEILHHYDQFSISTIDAFFQRVIRSFTREANLTGDYRLEIDNDVVLREVIDDLVDDLKENSVITQWVVDYARDNLENEKAYDVREGLIKFAEEIFKDEFKAIEKQLTLDTADEQFFPRLKDTLWKIKSAFLKNISKPASEIMQLVEENGWSFDSFKYKSRGGLLTFLSTCAYLKWVKGIPSPGPRIRNEYTQPATWPGSLKDAAAIKEVAEKELVPRLKAILAVLDTDYRMALSAELALKNMYVFGLITEIMRRLAIYKSENNVMLLAEAPKFLNEIIGDSDTPFVYEKVGSFYKHYLIDEFQDTSGFQWKNFLPLLTNSLDQGDGSVIVGDVKQAIYRWRGGDLNLLESKVASQIGDDRTTIRGLNTNYRSAKNIVRFNNGVFNTIASSLSQEFPLAGTAYHDVGQETSRRADGFVEVTFLETDDETNWRVKALNLVPQHLEKLQRSGVALGDIAILVRSNLEGHKVATALLEYGASDKASPECKYDVVSNDSLRIDGAASVNLLLGAMRYLLNPNDAIARAQLSYEYAKLFDPSREESDVFAVTNQVFFESQLPEKFASEKLSLRKLPLFELSETIIDIFNLGKVKGELTYLQAFQDKVLDFNVRERNDLESFLEWWDKNADKESTSIKISGDVQAAKIFTIHKAKGLQFKYVILPFCSWQIDHDSFHAPNLWVRSEAPPFDKFGNLSIEYGRKLSDTVFNEFYDEERMRSHIDNLNMLYVAVTRAESGMIITAPDKSSAWSTVATWLYEGISSTSDLKEFWSETSKKLSIGELDKQMPATLENWNTISLRAYETSRWRDKLVIRQSGHTFFESPLSSQRERIFHGIHIHTIFSRIKYAAEVPQALRQLIDEGKITENETEELQIQINELLGNKVVASWFDSSWDVRTEVPILLPGGKSNRIDRLLLNGKRAVVVDFKTGEVKKEDQKQVKEYMDIVKAMGFTEVEGYLLYTRHKEVVSMSDGKLKPLKKKDDKQLGLNF